ncbi:dihydrofolate reductase [Mycoplasma sp. SG1]|uniref:dihydrofolate reductase n=1 Tax=Mycoplasma sp. SG1 TaxID=2810348 RepID=UPI0020243353|nr:dihydrofolate reductase [Mycoplasma sp. SG1]URM52961.1 dihydrofolate reductase [Mycoplasma sp. SG1]
MLAIIVAMTDKNVIGKNGKLPWSYPEELQNFKYLTHDHKIIFGRKTVESIGKSLPSRSVFLLTSQKGYKLPYKMINPLKIVHDYKKIIKKFALVKDIIFVGGGREVYELFLPYCKYLYISRINKDYEGDTFFPELDLNDFELCIEEVHPDFRFQIWKRISAINLKP